MLVCHVRLFDCIRYLVISIRSRAWDWHTHCSTSVRLNWQEVWYGYAKHAGLPMLLDPINDACVKVEVETTLNAH